MDTILLPSTIEFHKADVANAGYVVITPCHQGYGTTVGNALRRVLLSSLPGAAVESIKIDGVQHEFAAIEGVREDVVEIILNVKQLAVKSFSEEPVTLTITKKGIGDVTAADIEKNADIEIANPELKLCTITGKDTTFTMELVIGKGRGYVPAAQKDTKQLDLGTIAIDSLYTPVRDVGYDVQMTRVGDVVDYEKLTLTVVTNGTITPEDAVTQAARLLIDHFSLLTQGMAQGAEMAGEEEQAVSDESSEEDVS